MKSVIVSARSFGDTRKNGQTLFFSYLSQLKFQRSNLTLLMNRIYFLVLAISLSVPAFAQDQSLSLEDAVSPRLSPQSLSQLNWRGDTDQYAYTDGTTLMGGAPMQAPQALLSLVQLGESLGKELKRFPSLSWDNSHTFSFFEGETRWKYDLNTGKAVQLAVHLADAENVEVSPAGHLAFTHRYNLYLCDSGTVVPYAITFDGDRQIVYGEPAHRNEFGIRNGSYWSPNGQQLAFYRIDQSMVTDYPIVQYDTKPARYTPAKYPMAGDKSHHATVGIYDLATRKTLYLQTGLPAEQYLTNLTWSPDGKQLYIAVINRDQNHMELRVYETATGKYLRTLFEEKNEKYVEPEHGPLFFPGQPEEFLWFSERDGYNHLYHYRTDGSLIGQVTQGDWEVIELLGFGPDNKQLFISATAESPVERHAYAVKVSNGKITRLTESNGMHQTELSPSASYLLDSYNNLKTPGISLLRATKKGQAPDTLLIAEDPLSTYQLGKVELFSLQAEDGTELHCRMVKPVDFDPAKKYPVMIYVYGGPHVQLVRDTWQQGSGALFDQYMAQRGYVVFTLDNRGSAYRGRDFEQAIFRQMGTLEMEDQLVGVAFLKGQSFVDSERIGVYGWSYGGFMTTSLMLRNPGVFKAAVAGGPVIDWRMYEVMYGERYMDTPQQNPEGYETAKVLNYVKNLDGKLLVIHGLLDATVVPEHTALLLEKAVQEGKYIDYYPYPNHEHNVRGPERAHLFGVISRYFDENLK